MTFISITFKDFTDDFFYNGVGKQDLTFAFHESGNRLGAVHEQV